MLEHKKETRAMSVYLQSLNTDKYVAGPEQWTDRPEKARQFGGGTEALFFCYQHRLGDVQILGRFPNPRENFTISLRNKSFE